MESRRTSLFAVAVLASAMLALSLAGSAAAASPPIVSSAAASDVGPSSATVSGTVNPNGQAATWWVEYGTSATYGAKTPAKSAGSGTTNVDVSASLSGLAAGTTYHFRLVAMSGAGTTQGADATFATPAAPTVVTATATSVTSSAATLNATVDPKGRATTWYFEYGTGTGYGSKTPAENVGSGTGTVHAASTISNLQAGTLYHFRLVATSDAGTTNGGDRSFSTTGSAPVVATSAASSVTASGARLNGSVNPNGQQTTAWFEYGTSTSYGLKTPVKNAGSRTSSTNVSASISHLGAATAYHFRLVASNASGTTAGNDQTFATTGPPTVQTGPAQGIGATGATFTGSINPNGRSTNWYFEYGPTASYGSKTATRNGGSGTGASSVSAAVSALAAGTSYHFRLVASSGAGTGRGADAAFTTAGSVVTLRAAGLRVAYGRSVTLLGAVSSHLAGEKVTVLASRFGDSAFSSVATVSTGAAGAWSYAAKPTIRTSYQATWNGGTSSMVTVGVSPAVSLRVLSKGRFSTHVAAGRSFAGRIVQLQRLSSGRWLTWSRARLNASSSAVFRPRLPRGTSHLRIAMSVNQAGPGYLAGFSRSIVYRR